VALAVSEFQLVLVQLAADLGIKIGRLLASMERLDRSESLEFMTTAYPGLAMAYLAASNALSVEFYNEQPTFSDYVAEPIDLLPEERLAASGRWAMLQNNPTRALIGSAERAVMDQSRGTILENVEAEEGATWARHASANACPFCRMLSTRLDVYRSEETASFLAHDSCHCIAVMVRPGDEYEPPPYVAQWEEQYIQARKDAGSGDPKDILSAWNRALRK